MKLLWILPLLTLTQGLIHRRIPRHFRYNPLNKRDISRCRDDLYKNDEDNPLNRSQFFYSLDEADYADYTPYWAPRVHCMQEKGDAALTVPGPSFTLEPTPDIDGLWETEINAIQKRSSPALNVAPKGQSFQSSTKRKFQSRYAINGHLSSSCTMTTEEFEPWWTLDLMSNHVITFVAVTNRRDCCAKDLDGAEIHIGNNVNWKENPSCGTVSSIGLGETFSFTCGGMQGQFVTIAIPEKNTSLSLCEVQVFGIPHESSQNEVNTFEESKNLLHGAPNVAPRGTASHSSSYDSRTPASRAIDGSLNIIHPACTHTQRDGDPWWTVDLHSKMRIYAVAITNRGDCCGFRINGAEVRIGDSKGYGNSNARCAIISTIPQGQTLAVNCHGMEGQYVSVVIDGRKEALTLCEVQVFALPAEKKEGIKMFPEPQPTKDPTEPKSAKLQEAPMKSKVGKETTVSASKFTVFKVSQSSTKDEGLAKNAVDGMLTPQNPGSQCAVTEEQYEPWWKVELKREYKIHSVAITSRKDCCSSDLDGAEIRVGHNDSDWRYHNICGTVSAIGLGETVLFNCSWMVGKFVTIVMPDRATSLTLCEVQVFGRETENITKLNGGAENKKGNHGVRNVAPRGLIFQSSYYDRVRFANVVVDGNLATHYFLRSCTQTEDEQDPWWRIDMLSRMRVSSVAITNGGDCCAERLNGAEIHIGDSEVHGGRNNPRCAKINRIPMGQTFIFDCDGMEGRFFSVIIPGSKKILQLCEVQVFAESLEEGMDQMYPNVALNGIASQSSTFSTSGEAQNANDGSLANNHIKSQCSITQREVSPWWMVDLQSTYKIFAVVITNRVLECCKDRISGAEIRIGNSLDIGGTLNPRCGVITSMESGESLYFACNGMVGQYVTVTIPERVEHLILCEVQVFGAPDFSGGDISDMNEKILEAPQGAPNLALSGRSFQSSLYNFFGESKNAIDGSLSSNYSEMSCSQTHEGLNPWWTVDLKGIFLVLSVAVTNREDCCWERLNNAEIRIGNSQEWIENPSCTVIHLLGRGSTGMFNCKGMEGRYVTVLLPDKIDKLSLCEVQVFGVTQSSVGFPGSALMFPEEGNRSYAILQPKEPLDLREFTLCLRVSSALDGRREVILFSYFKDSKDELNVWRELNGRLSLYLRTSESPVIFSLPGLSTLRTHICVTWKSFSGVASLWIDGKMSSSKVYRKGQMHYVSPGGTVILGQDQDTLGGNFDAKQSFVGEISDVHLWDHVLTASAINDAYEKKQTTRGNIIDWSSVDYSVHGNVVIQSINI